MSRIALSLILVFNSFGLAACSGYKSVAIPTGVESGVGGASDAPVLQQGANARVYLRSGEVHEGEVMAVSDETVTLGNPSNYGFVEQTYAFSDIEKCEMETSSQTQELIIGVSVGLVVAAAVAFMWYMSGGWD